MPAGEKDLSSMRKKYQERTLLTEMPEEVHRLFNLKRYRESAESGMGGNLLCQANSLWQHLRPQGAQNVSTGDEAGLSQRKVAQTQGWRGRRGSRDSGSQVPSWCKVRCNKVRSKMTSDFKRWF